LRMGTNDIKVFDQLARDLNIMAERLEFSQKYLESQVLAATQALREQKDAAETSNNASAAARVQKINSKGFKRFSARYPDGSLSPLD
jgi:nitrate/nitrite-specific signal transduction histidine kinase